MENTRITIVDLGNMNIKYYGEDGQGIFSSKISTDFESYEDGFQRVEYDNQKTYIGIGELSREFSKAERQYLPQLLYAISKANENIELIDTNLTLLLPSIQMQNKSKLIDVLKGKDFNIKFNGQDRIISIKNVLVLPEGYVSYFSLITDEKQGDLCIVDIGSRTVNISVLQDAKIQKLNTVKSGTFDFYSRIKSIENAKGNDFVEEDIQRLIKNETIKVFQKQYQEFLDDILNSIKPYVNLKTYFTIFTGGGSLLLQEHINKLTLPNFKIHEDALNSNLLGALRASELVWKVSVENAK
jgi:plasmid segregation protein ParM